MDFRLGSIHFNNQVLPSPKVTTWNNETKSLQERK